MSSCFTERAVLWFHSVMMSNFELVTVARTTIERTSTERGRLNRLTTEREGN
jgi:hypothetical protein